MPWPCCEQRTRNILPDPHTIGVEEAMKVYYKEKILPMEERHDYTHFGGPPLDDAEFTAKPSVLLVGQYSVGKTSMIKFLLGRDYPGARIGPEPTTDQFVVIVKSETDERKIMGNTLVTEASFPFKSLSKFGNDFLMKLVGATCNSKLLDYLILIDTPGILSGEKQRISRGYDFEAVIRFMAQKVDRIILLFDISKLDISDEFRVVIQALKGNEEKVKIVLNKADHCELGELNRVRGALMYNLGRILPMPEIPRVFIGSFWDGEVKNKKAFYDDYKALIKDLTDLPKTVKIRKINDIAKRAKHVKVHALVMDELIRQNSLLCSRGIAGKNAAKDLKKLERVYSELMMKHRITPGDLPVKAEFQELALCSDPRRWKRMDLFQLDALDEFIQSDTTKIISALPADDPEEAKIMADTLDESTKDNQGISSSSKSGAPHPPGFKVDEKKGKTPMKETKQEKKDPNPVKKEVKETQAPYPTSGSQDTPTLSTQHSTGSLKKQKKKKK